MAKSEHECIIGLLYHNAVAELTSLHNLRCRIYETRELNDMCRRYGRMLIVRKEWTLKDYADKRKSTNLTRFDFCPECGKKIDWAAIRRADNGE